MVGENLEKYYRDVCRVFIKIICNMKGVDASKVNKKMVQSVVERAVYDLLVVNYTTCGEFGIFDEFTAEQLINNCNCGTLQARISEFLGTSVTISRYGKEDLSDIEIQLVNREYDVISAIEYVDKRILAIRDNFGNRELRYQDGNIKFKNGNNLHEIFDVKQVDLLELIEAFQTKKIDDFIINNDTVQGRPRLI